MNENRLDRGILVTFSGIDGAGKSTLGRLLMAQIAALPSRPRTTFIKLISADQDFFINLKLLMDLMPGLDPEVQNWLFAFERFRRSNTVLRDALMANDVVIVDRYLYCDMAYNMARGLNTEMIRTMIENAPLPDIAILVDGPVEVALERISQRGRAVWKFQENEILLRQTREAYLDIAEEYGLTIVDGTDDANKNATAMANLIPHALGLREMTDGPSDESVQASCV